MIDIAAVDASPTAHFVVAGIVERGAQITIRRVHRRHAYASPPGKKKRKGEH